MTGENAKKVADRLQGKPSLDAIKQYPQEYLMESNRKLETKVFNHAIEQGVNADKIVSVKEKSMTLKGTVKTGDGGDSPYAPSKEGLRHYWDLTRSTQYVGGDRMMRWPHLTYCPACDELYDVEEDDIIKKKNGERGGWTPVCPQCEEKMQSATAPKWMHFKETIEFDEPVKCVSDLERELSKIFDIEVEIK